MRIDGYVLREPIGRGGSGEVWDAVHAASGWPVAIKVLVGAHARDPSVVEFLRHEVRAAASLDHPHVVGVLDHGVTDDGVPWLAMERVDGPPLSRLGPLRWAAQRSVLLAVLDALAHAHARGVLHRDVKPGNLLVAADGTVKLVDFGLARLRSSSGGHTAPSGATPAFTAPEQLLGTLAEQGPWTDLYAVGCVGWRLAAGSGPHAARTVADAIRAHLSGDVPAFVPRGPVPSGLEPWLRRLLARDPADRFRRAADAAWALAALPEAASPTADPDVGLTRPPIPPGWRALRRPRVTVSGTGLGLYGLRAVPLVGRAAQQDRLWSVLREERVGARVVVLYGPSGVGKSRLAEWLLDRAHEVGAAEALILRPDPGGAGEGFRAALLAHTGCGSAPEERWPELVRGWTRALPPVEGLEDVVLDLLLDRVGSAAERRGLAVSVLRAMARARPVVLLVDDAHRDPGAEAFLEALVRAAREPVLALATTLDEAALPASFDRLPVPPLGRADRRELVRELLKLDGELAAEVEEASGGLPAFAVHLVGDWVGRGVLVADRGGFRLAPGAVAVVPASLRAVGDVAVERVASGPHEAPAVLAALLGMEVRISEWESACRAAGVVPAEESVDALVGAGLARRVRQPPGFAFAHGLAREALVARAGARAAQWHRACAAAVRDPTRRGLHLVAAGDDEAALEPLLDSLTRADGDDDYRRAAIPLRARDEALNRLGVPIADPRWGEGRLHAARALRLQGDWIGAEQAFRGLVDDAERWGWPIAVRARLELAMALRARGRAEEALRVLSAAEAEAARDPWTHGAWSTRMALLCHDRRRLAEGRAHGERSLALFARLGLPLMAAHAHVALSMIEGSAGRPAHVETHLVAARDAYVGVRSRAGAANTWNNLGDHLRGRGDAEGAARAYRQSARAYDEVGSGNGVLPRTNLGLLELDAGRPAQARPILEEGARELARQGRVPLLAAVEVALACACARLQDGPGFDRWADAALGHVAATDLLDGEAARHAAEAARCWPSEPARAAAAARLADRLGGGRQPGSGPA